MDAIEKMNEISLRAKENGMSLTEYLRTYDSAGLDNIQSVIKQGMSDNQKNIDGFRQNNNIRRQKLALSGASSESLDRLQAEVSSKLETIRSNYAEIRVENTVDREVAIV